MKKEHADGSVAQSQFDAVGRLKAQTDAAGRTTEYSPDVVTGLITRITAGSPLTVFVVCPTGCASCRTPVGASHPPWSAICEKKARTFVRALL
nr:RHS repeat domain-containing protein [Escherichia coli]